MFNRRYILSRGALTIGRPSVPDAYASAFLELFELRKSIDATLHRMVNILDAMDSLHDDLEDDTEDIEHDGCEPDEDGEASLGWPNNHFGPHAVAPVSSASVDLELDDADHEPSLASPEHIFPGDQTAWARGNDQDREDDDDREPDNDNEPSLGAPEHVDQEITWGPQGMAGFYIDAEQDDSDDEPSLASPEAVIAKRESSNGIVASYNASQVGWASGCDDDREHDDDNGIADIGGVQDQYGSRLLGGLDAQ